jgi:hypothetical protein
LQGRTRIAYIGKVSATIIKTVRELIADRDRYCDQRNYPRELTHPAGNWEVDADNNSIHELFQKVISGDERVLRNLRLYSQPFSGFDLNRMEVGEGRPESPASLSYLSKSDPWVRRYYQITSFMPPDYRMAMPNVLGERGQPSDFDPQGLINHDAYAYQERINLLYESGVLAWLQSQTKGVTLLEVGGGFGGLAYGLLRCLKVPVRYIIVDLPESLLYAALYLSETLPHLAHTFDLSEQGNGIVYVPNYKFDEWIERNPAPLQLAINTLSLVEMSALQMEYYAEKIGEVIGQDGVFFEQNHDGRWLGFRESKRLLASRFRFGIQLKPRTIPCLVNGRADLWASVPPTFLDPYRPENGTLPSGLARTKLALSDSLWPQFWLLLRLQRLVSPGTFARIRSCWNRFGWSLAK